MRSWADQQGGTPGGSLASATCLGGMRSTRALWQRGASSSNETPSEDYDEAVESENDSEEPEAETRDDDLETIQEDGTNLVRDRLLATQLLPTLRPSILARPRSLRDPSGTTAAAAAAASTADASTPGVYPCSWASSWTLVIPKTMMVKDGPLAGVTDAHAGGDHMWWAIIARGTKQPSGEAFCSCLTN